MKKSTICFYIPEAIEDMLTLMYINRLNGKTNVIYKKQEGANKTVERISRSMVVCDAIAEKYKREMGDEK